MTILGRLRQDGSPGSRSSRRTMVSLSRRGVLGATAARTGSGVLAACLPPGQTSPPAVSGAPHVGGARRGGAIISGSPIDPLTLDAHAVADNYSRRIAYANYDPLVRESPDKTEVLPALAEKWEQASDGMSWTLSLRRGVKFHERVPFNAAAAECNLDRQIDPNHPNNKDGNWPVRRLFLSPVASVDIVDKYTIRLNRKRRYASLMNYLTTIPSSRISPKAHTELGKDVAERPLSTGPFRHARRESKNHRHGKPLVLGLGHAAAATGLGRDARDGPPVLPRCPARGHLARLAHLFDGRRRQPRWRGASRSARLAAPALTPFLLDVSTGGR